MDSLRSLPGSSSRFDDFLFATIGEDGGGMQLSVLSALARADVDPWEEAMSLAVMPKNVAQVAMVAMLERVPDRNWTAQEMEQIAARLVRLLPQERNEMKNPEGTIDALGRDRQVFWLVMTVIFVAMSVMSPRHSSKPPNADVATTQQVPQLKPARDVEPASDASPGAGRQPD